MAVYRAIAIEQPQRPAASAWHPGCSGTSHKMRFVWQQPLIPLVLVSALVGWRYHAVNDPTHWSVVRVERPLMGTVWNIEVVDRGQPDVAQVAVNAAYRELKRIDDLMSEWKPESPISQVDAAAGQHAVEVPA